MSTLKSKIISAPVNGATVESLTLQTNNVDRVTVSPTGSVDVAGAMTAGSLQVGGVATDLRPLVSAVAKTATGASVDFTGIPSWAKRITVMLRGVSFAAAGISRLRLGTSSGLVASGYTSNNTVLTTTGTTVGAVTDGLVGISSAAAATTINGQIVITQIDTNTWVASATIYRTTDDTTVVINGNIALSGALDRLSLVATTSTFDAGTVNILYEG